MATEARPSDTAIVAQNSPQGKHPCEYAEAYTMSSRHPWEKDAQLVSHVIRTMPFRYT